MESLSWVQQEELRSSLRRFLKLFDDRRDVFWKAEECWGEASKSGGTAVVMFLIAITVGVPVGIVSGGLFGALGSVGAAICLKILGNADAADLSTGLLSSSMGGLVGGAICGSVGCLVEMGSALSDEQLHRVTSGVMWSSLGAAAAGIIGIIFGGSIGAVGGMVGGAVGGGLSGLIARFFAEPVNPRSGGEGSVSTELLQASVQNFVGCLHPMEEELLSFQKICAWVEVGRMQLATSAQTAKALAAFRSLQEALDESAPCWTEAAQRSDEALEELEKMKVEAEKTLKMLV